MLPRVVALVERPGRGGPDHRLRHGAGLGPGAAADPGRRPTRRPAVVAEYQPDPPLPAEPVSAEAVAPAARPTRPARRDPPRPEPRSRNRRGRRPRRRRRSRRWRCRTPAPMPRPTSRCARCWPRRPRDLERVVYQSLDADGRAQYDTARRFMQQADEALKARNVVFAGKLADKAATMAVGAGPVRTRRPRSPSSGTASDRHSARIRWRRGRRKAKIRRMIRFLA